MVSFWVTIVSSQAVHYVKAFDNFQANFNAEKYDEIFVSFSPQMQIALPIENNRQFLNGLRTQLGKIVSKDFVQDYGADGVLYKAQFENASMRIYIKLDNQNKIDGLLIKPFDEAATIETASLNGLASYPKEIADPIFSVARKLPNNGQLSIAVLRNGNVKYYGAVRNDEKVQPAQNHDAVFEIGSITKVFTSTVLASLVHDHKIKLTDEINAFYPFDFKNNIKIKFADLANHTSGLPRLPENLDLSNWANPYKNYKDKEIEAYLKSLVKLESKPTQSYNYSNLGAGLLGYTLGISQKMSFQDLVQKRVFEKYQMNNSFTSSEGLENRLVEGMDKNGTAVANWDFDVLFGAGGMLSTTHDLAKFALNHFDPKNFELALTRNPTFVIDESLKIGLGWHILKSENGSDVLWHNGGTGGYSSTMIIDVANKRAVTILSNVVDVNNEIDDLAMKLINSQLK